MKRKGFKSLLFGALYLIVFVVWTLLIQIVDVQAGRLKCMLYWAVFILLVIIGAVKILLTRLRQERGSRIITAISVIVGITAVLLLAMGREAYGVSMLFLMIVAKGIVIYKMR